MNHRNQGSVQARIVAKTQPSVRIAPRKGLVTNLVLDSTCRMKRAVEV